MKSRAFAGVSMLALLILSAALTFAQGGPGMGRMTAEERTDRLAKQLDLADSVKAKVLVIFKASDEARAKAFEESQGDRESMRPKMEAIRNDTDAKLKGALTAEQYEKYVKAREEMMGRGRQGAPPPPPPADGK
jgi:Spy/CpxP family protein refolding chaperone